MIKSSKKEKDLIRALGKPKSYTEFYGIRVNEKKIRTMKKSVGQFLVVKDKDIWMKKLDGVQVHFEDRKFLANNKE